jgi:polyferredoxin
MKIFKNSTFILRLVVLLLFIVFLILFFNSTIYDNLSLRNKVTLTNFLFKSRILLVFLFGISGALIIYFIKMNSMVRAILSGLIFVFFGVLPALHTTHCFYKISSPLCALIKPVLFISQGSSNIPVKFIILLSTIMLLVLIGRNLFCGWVCPVGAIQDAVHFISKKKKKRLPFKVTNSIRSGLFFISFIVLVLTSFNIFFDFLNPFLPLQWKFSFESYLIFGWIVLIGLTVSSVFMYRPYCYLICPIGFITWLAGLFSILRIKVDKEKCTECMACVNEKGCPAIEDLIKQKKVTADCYLCGQCINDCPEEAISLNGK